jgi:hypothetical protein
MMRAAIFQLLEEQNFPGSLKQKIKLLDEQIKTNCAPRWASKFSAEFMAILKAVGDHAMHAADPSTVAPVSLEEGAKAEAVFRHLLEIVYEQPVRKNAKLAALDEKLKAARK